MAADAIVYCLENLTDYAQFERLSHDLMLSQGYKRLEPLGNYKDKGRDAIHISQTESNEITIFIYSVRKDWFAKLKEDAEKIYKHKHECQNLVLVCTADYSASQRDNAISFIHKKYGWNLHIYGIERIRTILSVNQGIIANHPQVFCTSFFQEAGSSTLKFSPEYKTKTFELYLALLESKLKSSAFQVIDYRELDQHRGIKDINFLELYIDLDTTTKVPIDIENNDEPFFSENGWRSLSILEAIANNNKLVLLGDPGSGKSTFITYLTLCLVLKWKNNFEIESMNKFLEWPKPGKKLIPIIVTLRDFSTWISKREANSSTRQIWNFIVDQLEKDNLDNVADSLLNCLDRGDAIMLFDGMDEIGNPEHRLLIKKAVLSFSKRYPKIHILITCRTLSYIDPKWKLPEFSEITIAPFSKPKITSFIDTWYKEQVRISGINSTAALKNAKLLKIAVQRNDISMLATNPLLLTVIALIHTHEGQLPDSRALLYEEAVDLLLWRWDQIKCSTGEGQSLMGKLLSEAGRSEIDLKKTLWKIAFSAHLESCTISYESTAEIHEYKLLDALAEIHPNKSKDWAFLLISLMKERTGLLIEKTHSVFSFPHRTFQEYLAGSDLSIQNNYRLLAAKLFEEGTFWNEVILLSVGRLCHLVGDIDKPLALAGELISANGINLSPSVKRLVFASKIFDEIGEESAKEGFLGNQLWEMVKTSLNSFNGVPNNLTILIKCIVEKNPLTINSYFDKLNTLSFNSINDGMLYLFPEQNGDEFKDFLCFDQPFSFPGCGTEINKLEERASILKRSLAKFLDIANLPSINAKDIFVKKTIEALSSDPDVQNYNIGLIYGEYIRMLESTYLSSLSGQDFIESVKELMISLVMFSETKIEIVEIIQKSRHEFNVNILKEFNRRTDLLSSSLIKRILHNIDHIVKEIVHENQADKISISTLHDIRHRIHRFETFETRRTGYIVCCKSNNINLRYYEATNKSLNSILIIPSFESSPEILDLQPSRSLIENLLGFGISVYLIDWNLSRNDEKHKYRLEDYALEVVGSFVNYILQKYNCNNINILGHHLGGVLAIIYSALNFKIVKNLITVCTPTNFNANHSLLFTLLNAIPVDKIAKVFKYIPAEMITFVFNMLNPARLMLDKYVGYLQNIDNHSYVENFLRMEDWIYSKPDMPIQIFKQVVEDLYQNNLLIENKLLIGKNRINLENIRCPVLNFYAKFDHIAPPSACDLFTSKIGSTDKEDICFDTGHIGIFVSSKCQREFGPKIADWLISRNS